MFRFIYTGCGAKSKNIFETKEECDKGEIDYAEFVKKSLGIS